MKIEKVFDYLDYESDETLEFIISSIEDLSSDGEGFLAGIKGDWGTGKTSVLRALESYYKYRKEFPVIFFEAWKYQDEHHPLIPLLIRLENLLMDVKSERLKSLGKEITKIAQVLLVSVSDIALKPILTGGVRDVVEGFKLVESLEEKAFERKVVCDRLFDFMRDSIEKIVKNYTPEKTEDFTQRAERWSRYTQRWQMPDYNGKRFVIIIDDLDRCLPDKAFSLIETIKFYLQNRNTIVILGINDKVITRYISDYYSQKYSKDIPFDGDDFMEKIIQWGYELPPVDYLSIKTKFGFDSIRCDDGFDDIMVSTGYLAYRKWLRIYNRIRGIEISQRALRRGDIAVSIIAECFPEIERHLRHSPEIVKALRSSAVSLEKEEELIKYIEGIRMSKDKTVAKGILKSIQQRVEE